MAKILLIFVVNLANSQLLAAFYAAIRRILSHFSFATELCGGLYQSADIEMEIIA